MCPLGCNGYPINHINFGIGITVFVCDVSCTKICSRIFYLIHRSLYFIIYQVVSTVLIVNVIDMCTKMDECDFRLKKFQSHSKKNHLLHMFKWLSHEMHHFIP